MWILPLKLIVRSFTWSLTCLPAHSLVFNDVSIVHTRCMCAGAYVCMSHTVRNQCVINFNGDLLSNDDDGNDNNESTNDKMQFNYTHLEWWTIWIVFSSFTSCRRFEMIHKVRVKVSLQQIVVQKTLIIAAGANDRKAVDKSHLALVEHNSIVR